MADKFSKETRSRIMSRIRHKWTAIEKKVHSHLKAMKIKHKMHPALLGKPDILIPGKKAVVFIDGCFWHKCPKHGHIPKSNIGYWKPKIERNAERRVKYKRLLKKEGFKVISIWEHDIKERFDSSMKKITR
jgi:DNA mismatch endonuclease (patch repair protein)